MRIINEDPVHLIAEEGMVLTDGQTYSTEVWLAKLDKPEYWHEIPETEIPEQEESSEESELAVAARILLGL